MTTALAQLAKRHRYELAPAGETASVALGIVLLLSLLKFWAGKQLEQLGKLLHTRFKGGSLPSRFIWFW